MNFNYFAQAEKLIQQMKKDETDDEEANECEHDFLNIEGARTCRVCGIVQCYLFDETINYETQKIYKHFRPYERFLHLKMLMRRLSGYKYENKYKKEITNTDEIPETLTQIRKWIKQNKMNIKNDYYYWRQKYNVDTQITSTHIYNWISIYKKLKTKTSPRDFLYEHMKDIDIYKKIVPLVERKIQKVNRIQS